MKQCVICKNGSTQPGSVTITLERGGSTLVIQGVPAHVCQNYGEAYVDEDISAHLLPISEQALRSGVPVAIRQFVAA
ncbi:MAG: type II toxin-antitoxin system MqsA family antitoxin [Chloroflexi bacterium]|nr:type II toxin-antitoxin system MqsA family antitoxin [Chloroflexota bacterium]